MGFFEGIKQAMDVTAIAVASTNASTVRSAYDQKNENFGIQLANQVEGKGLDPTAAEYAMSAELTAQAKAAQAVVDSPRIEKGAQALERLVETNVIDPVFAEDMLNTNFALWCVTAAINRAAKDKKRQKDI